MDLPTRETAAYILDRLIGEWRRYGHIFSVVRLELPASTWTPRSPRLQSALRERRRARALGRRGAARAAPRDRPGGADVAAERLRDAVREFPVLAGAVQ
jgi:hypothetical protein